MFCLIVALYSAIIMEVSGAYTVFPAEIKVAAGEGFALRVLPATSPLVNCSVRFGGYRLQLGPDEPDFRGVSYWGRGLDAGECGAMVHTFNASLHAGPWLFYISTPDLNANALASVSIPDTSSSPQNITLVADLGEEALIRCEAEQGVYCTLSNPQQQVVHSGTNCTHLIPSVTVSDAGVWQCAVGLAWAALQTVNTITLQVETVQNLVIGQISTEHEHVLFCNHNTKNLTYCRWERSDGQVYLMADGRYFERYSYYGRGMSQKDCGLSIAKPLEKNDIGTWTCMLGLEGGSRSGGFVNIPSPEDGQSYLKMKKPEDVYILNGTQLDLDCSVGTSLSYCWFRHPNGTRFFADPDKVDGDWTYHGDSLLLGQCGLTIKRAEASDSGMWLCGMGVEGEEQATQDFQHNFTVTVADIPFIEEEGVVTVAKGQSAVMSCHALQGQALQYCSFFAPNNVGYNMVPNTNKSHRFRYHGSGLENGKCGIEISIVDFEDYGEWQCATKLLSSKTTDKPLVRSILLTAPHMLSSSSAAAVALVVGLALMVVIGVGMVWYRSRRRRSQGHGGATGMSSASAGFSPAAASRPFALSTLSDGSDDVTFQADVGPAGRS